MRRRRDCWDNCQRACRVVAVVERKAKSGTLPWRRSSFRHRLCVGSPIAGCDNSSEYAHGAVARAGHQSAPLMRLACSRRAGAQAHVSEGLHADRDDGKPADHGPWQTVPGAHPMDHRDGKPLSSRTEEKQPCRDRKKHQQDGRAPTQPRRHTSDDDQDWVRPTSSANSSVHRRR